MADIEKPITIDSIRVARNAISGQVIRTPFLPAPSQYENLQVTSAFKERKG